MQKTREESLCDLQHDERVRRCGCADAFTANPGLVATLGDTALLFGQISVIPSSYFTYPAIITGCQSRHIAGDQSADRSLYQPQRSQNTY